MLELRTLRHLKADKDFLSFIGSNNFLLSKKPITVIRSVLKNLKKIFIKILHIGSKDDKDLVVDEVSYCYDNELYNENDLIDIGKDTERKEEIYDIARIKNHYDRDNDISI